MPTPRNTSRMGRRNVSSAPLKDEGIGLDHPVIRALALRFSEQPLDDFGGGASFREHDSVAGSIVAAMIIGVLESLGTGYLDPRLGGGFGNVACYLLLLAMLMVRPHGMFGRGKPERV